MKKVFGNFKKSGISGMNMILLAIMIVMMIAALVPTGCSGGGPAGGATGSTTSSSSSSSGGTSTATWVQVFPPKVGYRPVKIRTCMADMTSNILCFINILCQKTLTGVVHAANRYFHAVKSRGAHSIAAGNNGEVIVSHNNGNGWTAVSSNTGEPIWSISDRGNGKFCISGGDKDPIIRNSDDNGDTWHTPTIVNGDKAMHFYCSDRDPDNPNIIVYGGEGGYGISTDNGNTVNCGNEAYKLYAICHWGNGWIFAINASTSTLQVYKNNDMTNCIYKLALAGISSAIFKVGNNLYVGGFALGGGKIWKITVNDLASWDISQPIDLTSKIPNYTTNMGFWSLSAESSGVIKLTASFGNIYSSADGGNTWVNESAETSALTQVNSVDVSDPNSPKLGATGEDGTIIKKVK